MPNLEVTREELEALIEIVLSERLHYSPSIEIQEMLPDLHLKLENALELWINGGTIEIPVSPKLKALGVCNHEIVYQPHDEGIKHG